VEPRLTLRQARELLGVAADADARVLRRAWARALQAARPDVTGDETLYRRVIAAHRLLTAGVGGDAFVLPPAPAGPPPRRDHRCELLVSSTLASAGGWRTVTVDGGGVFRVRVPAGTRDGVILRLPRCAPQGGDLLIALRVPGVAPSAADTLRRRFSAAWAA